MSMIPKPDRDQGPEDGRPRRLRYSALFFWIALGILLLAWLYLRVANGPVEPVELPYSTFLEQVEEGSISQITIAGERITGEFTAEAAAAREEETASFITYVPAIGDERLLPLLQQAGVLVETEPAAESLWPLLLNFLPLLLLIGVAFWFLRRNRAQGQSLFNMGNSRAKRYEHAEDRTTFTDVAGLEGPKVELQEIIDYLIEPERVARLGGVAPKGILLVGPPGTGKTLLARAVAGEAEVPFFSITGSDFMEMFVGVGASRVRNLFEQARTAAPCIIFIDELDSIGRRRGAGLGGGHDEREQTLNQLLSELDGFEPSENVVVMAATNRADILDPALLRPGRFDRQITVDLPSVNARKDILAIHARNKPMADDIDLMRLAQGTPGFSGADLENVLNEAALLAARRRKQRIYWDDVDDARDKIMMGLRREGLALTDDVLEMIAYHEAGHALCAALLPHADPIHKVTVVPRGRAMGVTQQLPEREKYIYKREYLLDRLVVMMGGRVAETLVYGTATSGAENDLKQATQLARRMVLDWGMSEDLDHIALGGEQRQVFLGSEISQQRLYSEATARDVDVAVQRILDDAYGQATSLITEYRAELDTIAADLVDMEELPGERVLEIVGAHEAQGDKPVTPAPDGTA